MRKLFETDGVRGTANKYPMTPEMALRIGKAAALVFGKNKKIIKIIIIILNIIHSNRIESC